MRPLHYDVLERIFQFARHDQDELTLRAWSRVAHIWTPLAQRALFRTVTLSGPQHARRLIFHFRHAPHLQQHVRVLESGIDFTTRPRIRSTLVPLVHNIESIAFLDVFPDWELLSCFPGLTSVRAHVGTYNYRDTSTGSKSPALTAIALREYEFLYTINPFEPTPEFPQETFCTWLSTTATHAQGSLRSASFMVTKPQDLSAIAQLLSTHAQLQHLTLQLLTPIVAASIGTSHLTSLHIESRLYRKSLNSILGLLQRATFPYLRTLSLSFHGRRRLAAAFHPFDGQEYSPTRHALPESLASQLTELNIRFEHFSFILAYKDFLSVFADAQKRGILNVHRDGVST